MRHDFAMGSVPKINLPGVELPVSQLILGCDNKDSAADGAPVWDRWLEVGGTAFDTAHVYGDGMHERALGDWISQRGVAGEIAVIVKGGHSPHCNPEAIVAQLEVSLERLQLAFAPIYVVHRDNPDVPVGEFVDVLNGLRGKGLIGVFGGSNWSVARFRAANDYAIQHRLQPFSILNNNLSLAIMETPVWPGCMTSHDDLTLKYLRDSKTAHFSWSAQARGYFLQQELRNRLPVETGPETCFGSPENAERRNRAEQLAGRKGVTANSIAAAWVLAQSFPSFALVGPRTIAELVSTLEATQVSLTPDEVAWLDLK